MSMLRSKRLTAGVFSAMDVEERTEPELHYLTTIYTAPAGYRAILRDWRMYYAGAAGSALVRLQVVLSGGAAVYFYYATLSHQGEASWGAQGDVILHAGDALRLVTDVLPFHYYLSGAEVVVPA